MNSPITEERYQFAEWLYRIRKQYPKMGLFQPDFICIIFGKMLVSKYQRSDSDIKIAVDEWCDGPMEAEVKYGHISKWNTAYVTNMKELFFNKSEFNDDISKWDVSNVMNMSYILASTRFDGDISKWDVSKVTDMMAALCSTPFNGDISGWNVSNVTNMQSMFESSSFDGNITNWNVSKVTDMRYMFDGNEYFNCDISKWDVSTITIPMMSHMFTDCPISNENKPIGFKYNE